MTVYDLSNLQHWSQAFLQLGSVRTYVSDSFFVYLGKLELFYRFKTMHGDSCSSLVRFCKRHLSVINQITMNQVNNYIILLAKC